MSVTPSRWYWSRRERCAGPPQAGAYRSPQGEGTPVISVVIRQLLEDDAGPYRALRLRALREFPQAFTSSYEEESGKALEWSERRLKQEAQRPNDVFMGAFSKCIPCFKSNTKSSQSLFLVKDRRVLCLPHMF